MSTVRTAAVTRPKFAVAAGLVLITLAAQAAVARAQPKVLHTYRTEFATELINAIPVSAANLVPHLPDGYELVPAAVLGLGGWDQGLVVIVNFQGANGRVDGRKSHQRFRTVIDLGIMVAEPAA